MVFSYNWLQSFFKKKLPRIEKLAELLTMKAFEVSEVKKSGKDWILYTDVLPNRAHDCFCHLGVAREIAAILNKKLNIPKGEKLKSIKGDLKPINLKIQCPQLVPRLSAIVIEDVKIGRSPQWLREKLKAVGIRSINNIVDLTNFVMLEMGQPLHAFDCDKIREQKMILRQSKKGEKVITLDDVERTLDDGMLVFEDKGRLIDLVGIMGGKLSEISSKTKKVVLQAGNFDRRTIYQTTKKLAHSTDASNIFTQGIDPNLTIPSLERTYFLLKQLGGGKVVQIIDFYPQKVLPKRVRLDLDYVERLLGVKIPEKEIKNILKRLDFQIIKVQPQYIDIKVPTRRMDVALPEDLIEEIGRIYGYQKIPSVFPVAVLIPPKKNLEIFWEDNIKNILKEGGLTETYNYSFISEKDAKIFRYQPKDLIEVENPISLEQKYLRPSLIPNLLKNIEKNQRHFNQIKVFELGKIFTKAYLKKSAPGKTIEKKMLTGAIAESDQKTDSFYQLKGIVDLLLRKLGISNVWYDSYQPTPQESKLSIWHPKNCAEIKINGKEIGFLGEISPRILDNLKIKTKVVIFDVDFEKLQKFSSEEIIYWPISRYPAAVRDIAVLVPRVVRVVEVLNKINAAGGKLIRDIDLFDIYEGERIPRGKKNLAFHIIYQAEDRTLSSKEIGQIQQKIIKALEEDPEWQVRK